MARVRGAAASEDSVLTLGALLCDLPDKTIRKLMRHWGASNERQDALRFFTRHVGSWSQAGVMPLCDFKRLVADPNFARLVELWALQEYAETGGKSLTQAARDRADGIDADQVSPPPFVTGGDLCAIGMLPGPAFGEMLRTLYDAQLNEEITTRPDALARAIELAGK